MCEIERPGLECCKRILAHKAARLDRRIPEAVLEVIAVHLERTNIRELEGALLKVVAMGDVSRLPITVPLAQSVLKHHSRRSRPLARFGDIESMCGTYFGVGPAELHSSRRTRTVALARNVAMYLARKYTRYSLNNIGQYFSGRNHSVVLHAERRVDTLIRQDRKLKKILVELEEELA